MFACVEILGVFFFVGLGLLGWWMTHEWDKSRIEDYLGERRSRVASITRAPFGRGWFGEKNDRIYEVIYYDSEGRQHAATCKTSLLSGVYWTEDRVSHSKPRWWDALPEENRAGDPLIKHIESTDDDTATRLALLEAENEALRRELAQKSQGTVP